VTRRKLYFLILALSLAGYCWVFLNELIGSTGEIRACLFKNITGIPCPSCGVTRSVSSIISGNIFEALSLNPFGFLVIVLLVVLPLWIGIDLLRRKESFFLLYQRAEKVIQQKQVAIPLILLVLFNWIWNIVKHV